MKNKGTINEAIIEILKSEKDGLSAKIIYSRIVELDLYKFKAANPYHVVLTQLRRHCVGLDFPTAKYEKYFILLPDGTYSLNKKSKKSQKSNDQSKPVTTVNQLKKIYENYLAEFKIEILEQLKSIDPAEFENFSKKLLEVYGFIEMKITKKSRDGGLDGYGKLKVGISYLNVAFQCKKWKSVKISRVEIDKFRGATQGDYEQGIFFTTSEFSKEALQATSKKGAIPIILVDGNALVDLMIEKKFGIENENLPVYISALDDVLF